MQAKRENVEMVLYVITVVRGRCALLMLNEKKTIVLASWLFPLKTLAEEILALTDRHRHWLEGRPQTATEEGEPDFIPLTVEKNGPAVTFITLSDFEKLLNKLQSFEKTHKEQSFWAKRPSSLIQLPIA